MNFERFETVLGLFVGFNESKIYNIYPSLSFKLKDFKEFQLKDFSLLKYFQERFKGYCVIKYCIAPNG